MILNYTTLHSHGMVQPSVVTPAGMKFKAVIQFLRKEFLRKDLRRIPS